MNAVVALKAPKKTRKTAARKTTAKKKASRKFLPEGYALKDGRQVQMVPWAGASAPPWRDGYARVFIPFNEMELRNARGTKRGHEQIVSVRKLVRV